MDWSKLSQKEREDLIRSEQKIELIAFVKSYFDSFGWNFKQEQEELFVQKILPGEKWQRLIVVNAPHEEYPSLKELREILQSFDAIVVSSEFSPKMKKTSLVKEQHTASGINFSYCKK